MSYEILDISFKSSIKTWDFVSYLYSYCFVRLWCYIWFFILGVPPPPPAFGIFYLKVLALHHIQIWFMLRNSSIYSIYILSGNSRIVKLVKFVSWIAIKISPVRTNALNNLFSCSTKMEYSRVRKAFTPELAERCRKNKRNKLTSGDWDSVSHTKSLSGNRNMEFQRGRLIIVCKV